jgi:ubiquinone/menaquinone biosynthesis C-methylase UbiE
MNSLSFDPMVALYDETRCVDARCFGEALDYLAGRFPPSAYPTVLEPGIGTGRIAMPLATRGYRISGVDISPNMLACLAARLQGSAHARDITYRIADVTQLPFADGTFDLAIAVHLFYFIPAWQRAVDELFRVIKPGRPLIMMHTGTGMEVPLLNQRYKELCNCPQTAYRGAQSTAEVLAYAEGQGGQVETITDRWQWVAQIPLDRALSYLERRAYSYCALIPAAVHNQAIATMREEIRASVIEVPNKISISVLTRRQYADTTSL